MELWCPSRNVTPVYFCILCGYLVTNWKMHCSVLKHVSAYVVCFFFEWFSAVGSSRINVFCFKVITLNYCCPSSYLVFKKKPLLGIQKIVVDRCDWMNVMEPWKKGGACRWKRRDRHQRGFTSRFLISEKYFVKRFWHSSAMWSSYSCTIQLRSCFNIFPWFYCIRRSSLLVTN